MRIVTGDLPLAHCDHRYGTCERHTSPRSKAASNRIESRVIRFKGAITRNPACIAAGFPALAFAGPAGAGHQTNPSLPSFAVAESEITSNCRRLNGTRIVSSGSRFEPWPRDTARPWSFARRRTFHGNLLFSSGYANCRALRPLRIAPLPRFGRIPTKPFPQ